MPFLEHAGMIRPSDSAMIWRYMDFTKFVSMLHKRSLFFSNIEGLGDRFEGSTPKGNELELSDLPEEAKQHRLESLGYMRKLFWSQRQFLYVNCWHKNNGESAAMWKLYLMSNEGLAVRSTFGRLTASIDAAPHEVFAGEVRYIDYATDSIALGNALVPYTYKRASFAHEMEVRAMCIDPVALAHRGPTTEIETLPGLYVEADLEQLIEKVFVAPTSAEWFRELVEAMLKDHGIKAVVQRSDLDADPVL